MHGGGLGTIGYSDWAPHWRCQQCWPGSLALTALEPPNTNVSHGESLAFGPVDPTACDKLLLNSLEYIETFPTMQQIVVVVVLCRVTSRQLGLAMLTAGRLARTPPQKPPGLLGCFSGVQMASTEQRKEGRQLHLELPQNTSAAFLN